MRTIAIVVIVYAVLALPICILLGKAMKDRGDQ